MSELLYNSKNTYDYLRKKEIDKVNKYCEGYKDFLNKGKTERFCVKNAIGIASEHGFKPFKEGVKYKAGDKVYLNQKGKAAIFAVIGKKSMDNGFNITAAHIDCPRLDIKQNPLYEDNEIAYLKTHYYGGVKKYQWVTIPLSLVGVVCKKDGTVIDINIGDDENDPVFYITDLLPHLAADQMSKTLAAGVTGEMLNVVIGSAPDTEGEKNKTKIAILKILNEKYGIVEEDLLTSELAAVPAMNARDVGLDRSMIASFGHDDRICAYPCFTSLLELRSPEKTSVCVFADKEEIGSVGITGMRSAFLYDFLAGLCENTKANIRIACKNSSCISADVSAAYDPVFPEVFEKNNAAYINHGFAVVKVTGSRGKAGASDASAEFMSRVCRIFDQAKAAYQFCELGKVDAGGGGTVAQFIADRNIEVIDVGVPMLSMHAPYELAAKNDIYMLHKALKAFYEKN